MNRRFSPLLIAALVSAPLAAHDVWLEPGAFRIEDGGRTSLRILVGEGFRGQAVPRDPERIERFFAVGPEEESEVPGIDGAEPAGLLAGLAPGVHVVAYVSRPAFLTLDAERFERHLRQEGLERIVERRVRAGEAGAPVREVYSRCAKTLVRVGSGGDDVHQRPLGCRFEIVLEASPLDLGPGDELTVRLVFDGQPLAGALVSALPKTADARPVTSRSDAGGRALLRLSGPGAWLVKSVHMEAAYPGLEADWESWWASLTFAIDSE